MAENEEQKQPIAESHQEVKITIINRVRRHKQTNRDYQETDSINNRNYGKKRRIRQRNYFRRG